VEQAHAVPKSLYGATFVFGNDIIHLIAGDSNLPPSFTRRSYYTDRELNILILALGAHRRLDQGKLLILKQTDRTYVSWLVDREGDEGT
jgi:hypothetical protein